jgi:hypothetical protein
MNVETDAKRAKAIYSHEGRGSSEISLSCGDVIFILDDKSNPDWWKGQKEKTGGSFIFIHALTL